MNALNFITELERFDFTPRQATIVRVLTLHCAALGVEALRVDRWGKGIADLCGAERTFLAARHFKTELNLLAANKVLFVKEIADALEISVNRAMTFWNVAQKCAGAKWFGRLNVLRQMNELEQLRFEPGTFSANEETILETASAVELEKSDENERSAAPFFARGFPNIGKVFPIQEKCEQVGRSEQSSINTRHSCANANPPFIRARARAQTVKQIKQKTVQQLNCSTVEQGGKDDSNRLLENLQTQFARAHGSELATREMSQSGACWRMVARRWPDEFEIQIGELRNFIDGGGKFSQGAWFYFQYYFARAVGLENWNSVCKKLKESFNKPLDTM